MRYIPHNVYSKKKHKNNGRKIDRHEYFPQLQRYSCFFDSGGSGEGRGGRPQKVMNSFVNNF